MMKLWISVVDRPPIGSFFISYSSQDKNLVELLETALNKEGIPTIRDERERMPGRKIDEKVKEMIMKSDGMILCLSKRSLNSPWIPYELGFAEGYSSGIRRDYLIIPYILESLEPGEIPPFIRDREYFDKPKELINYLKKSYIYNIPFLSDTYFLSIEVTFDKFSKVLEDIRNKELEFGYSLIRYGRDDVISRSQLSSQDKEVVKLLNIAVKRPWVVTRIEESTGKVIVTHHIPIHNQWGTQFKLFVDVKDLTKLELIKKILEEEGAAEVSKAVSGHMRIFYTIPQHLVKGGGIAIVKSPEGITNNFIYPQ